MFWLLATELARRGHEINVITSDALGPNTRAESLVEVLAPRITVHRFRNPHAWLSAHLSPIFLRPIGMRQGLRKAVRSADVVHMGESRTALNVWASQVCAEEKVPLVWSAYGGLATATGIRGLYRSLHDVAFTRKVIPRVSRFIAQTEHERAVFRAHGVPSDNIRLIPLCVDSSGLEPLPTRGQLRERLGISHAAEVIVCVARLHPVKGIDTLMRSFARIQTSDRGPHLVVVGWDHGSLGSLTTLAASLGIASRVHFAGPLYGIDRFTAYVDGDMFALTPRVFEETSLAALEAAACGTPTALTAECEIPGLVPAGAGILMDHTEEGIAESLQSLLKDRHRRVTMGEASRQYVSENFTASRVAARHEDVFSELVGRSATSSGESHRLS